MLHGSWYDQKRPHDQSIIHELTLNNSFSDFNQLRCARYIRSDKEYLILRNTKGQTFFSHRLK